MKRTLMAVLLIGMASSPLWAGRRSNGYGYGTSSNTRTTQVDGYYRSNGTYVKPYTRTQSNSTTLDNYGTKGNYNPWTGQTGKQNPYNYGE